MARAEDPLSAIDWLSQSLVVPASAPKPTDTAIQGAVTSGVIASNALPEPVTSSTLGATNLDGVGLLAPAKTGLPGNLWGPGKTEEILLHIKGQRLEEIPALQSLLLTLLLAEAEAPADAGSSGRMLTGRIDKLLDMGALDQAMALMQATGDLTRPDLFRRMFDVALLTGAEDRACRRMLQSPSLSPAISARIFCLARSGDWQTATVLLQTAQAIGQIGPDQAELLSRFLDPELAELGTPLAAPSPITPLDLRMFEAIGEPLSIAGLPLAFAHSDLSETTGWKARLEAAERLSRAGAIAPNLLLGFYTQQRPAASGGVWDRVAAFRAFELALVEGEPQAIAKTLVAAQSAMEQVELEVVFAELFAERLAKVTLEGAGSDALLTLLLLSPASADLTQDFRTQDPKLAFTLALAQGDLGGVSTPDTMARAIAAAYADPELPQDAADLIDQSRVGEAILSAMDRITSGVSGEVKDVTAGLAILRRLGMEEVARRVALQLMLLERRG